MKINNNYRIKPITPINKAHKENESFLKEKKRMEKWGKLRKLNNDKEVCYKMFNQTLRDLSKCGYILVVENGICKLMDKDSRTIHLIFPANTSAKEKKKC